MLFTILVGVHVVLISMARTAVQAAADSAVVAAQAAGPGDVPCDGTARTARECEALAAARIAMIGSAGTVVETRPPAVVVDQERSTVTVMVFAGTLSPVLGGMEFTGLACGPLDDIAASQLTADDGDLWRC